MQRSLLGCYVVVAVVSAAIGSYLQAQTGNFPSNEDLRHYRRITEPRLSPDGKQVLYVVTESTADGGKSHLWLTDLATNVPRQITFSPSGNKADIRGEAHGQWIPDGSSIFFLAKRGEHAQLYRLPMNGGEAQPFDLKTTPVVDASRLPDFIATQKAASSERTEPQPIDVEKFEISPDGKFVAILAKDPESTAERKEHEDKADANWVDHDVHGTHLYLLETSSGKLEPTGVPTDADFVTWAPDSARLLAITEAPNSQGDLGPARAAYLVTIATPDHASKFDKLPPTIGNAAWSTDGQTIFFQAQAAHDAPPGYMDLYAYALDSQTVRNLTRGFNGSLQREEPVAVMGGGVLNAVGVGVNTTAMLLGPRSERGELLKFPTSLSGSFRTNAKQTGWVFLGNSSTQPPSIYYAVNLHDTPRAVAIPKMTPENSRAVQSKLVTWKNDQFTLEGLLYLPPQAANARVPLVVDVHGGPAGAWQDGYDPFVAMLNGEGWAVFRPNVRGGTNYAVEFVAADKNDLGGGDYRDLMSGVEFVVRNYPIDSNRLALFGYSYGGEMAGFVVGKTTRFRAIVSGAPVIDQYSEYGTEDNSWYDRWYFGKPWERVEDAWRQSPLAGAAHASTPFLLIQGEADKTDPLGQSQEMYRALRQMGVPVELVTYPREDHGPLVTSLYGRPSTEPWHGFDARRRIVEFLKKAFEGAK